MFQDITDDYRRAQGGKHYIRTVTDNCWISVLHRWTGFGHMEWETALWFWDPEKQTYFEGSPFIVEGDWREELADMPESELPAWYVQKRVSNPTSFDQVMNHLIGG